MPPRPAPAPPVSKLPSVAHVPLTLQMKDAGSRANDPLEREADRVAERAVRDDGSPAAKPSLRTAPAPQREAAGAAGPGVEGSLAASRGGGAAMDGATRGFMERRLGEDFSGVRVHADGEAARLSQGLSAHAFTVGQDVYFGAGRFAPHTGEGRRLLAHELAHTVQQRGGEAVQREEAVAMPPMTVRPDTMPSDISALSSPRQPGADGMQMDITAGDETSQLPGTALPFKEGGWDGADIANKMGQYDRIPGTDSDAVRCVQAVALMSHVLMGPSAAIGYLSMISFQGALGAAPSARQTTAKRVVQAAIRSIEKRSATYGDLYLAMEAVHDLFLGDDKGTAAGDVRGQITPMLDMSQSMASMDVWCDTPSAVMSQANALKPGEQLMLNTWRVIFNNRFFDLPKMGEGVKRAQISLTDEEGRNGRLVNINRLDTSKGKPSPSRIDPNRDSKGGHQMLIYKDAADGHIKMYEPELTAAGNHLFDLTDDSSVLKDRLFKDMPDIETFEYVQILGKMTPTPTTPGFGAGAL